MNKTIFFLIFLLIISFICISNLSAQDVQDIDETQLLLDDDASGEGQNAGESGDEDIAAPVAQSISTFTAWDFIRMILILGVVIGLIYILFYFLKKRGSPKLQNNDLFSIISTQAISNNRTMHLVKVGNQFFLIGSSDQSINLISEINDKETVDEIRLKLSNVNSGGERRNFRNIFSGLFGQGSIRLDGSVNTNSAFMKKQRDKLKRM